MPFRNVACSLNESHLVDFSQRRQSLLNFIHSALTQRNHSLFAGDALDLGCWTALYDHFAYTVRQVEQFANRGTAVIPGAGTFEATGAFRQSDVCPFFRLKAGFADFVRGEALLLFASVADDANEALGQDAVQRGDEIVRFDAHVDETADDIGDVVGVDGGENQVAG